MGASWQHCFFLSRALTGSVVQPDTHTAAASREARFGQSATGSLLGRDPAPQNQAQFGRLRWTREGATQSRITRPEPGRGEQIGFPWVAMPARA